MPADVRSSVRTAEQQRPDTRRRAQPAHAGPAERRWVTVAGVGALTLLCLGLALYKLGYAYWVDESMSIGISSHPITEIPTVLRQDGTPPLFYMLLHIWTGFFGTGEQATGALSVIFAVLCVPVAFWGGSSVFGRRAGWFCAALTAVNGLIVRYASETRMYSLMALLSLLATFAFLHAFVLRRRGYLPVFSIAICAMLYTHTWAVFFVIAALVGTGVCLLTTSDRRGVIVDALIAFGAAGVGFLPWVPNLLYQARNTGAPWAAIPSIKEPFLRPIVLWGAWPAAFVLLPMGALGVAHLLRRRRSPATVAFLTAAAMLAAFVLSSWVNARINPGWSPRYFIAIIGPSILVAAVALARAGRLGTVALIIVAVVGFKPWVFFDNPVGNDGLSNLKTVSRTIGPHLQPRDLVIGLEPGQVTTLYHYLPPGLRYATSMGPVRDPGVIDWRNVVDRLEHADVKRDVGPLIDALPKGAHVAVAIPNFSRESHLTRYFELVNQRGAELVKFVTRDPRLALLLVVPPARTYAVGASAHVHVFVKTR